MCVIKPGLIVKNYKDCLFNKKIILKSQQRFKCDHHIVYTEQINNINFHDYGYENKTVHNLK